MNGQSYCSKLMSSTFLEHLLSFNPRGGFLFLACLSNTVFKPHMMLYYMHSTFMQASVLFLPFRFTNVWTEDVSHSDKQGQLVCDVSVPNCILVFSFVFCIQNTAHSIPHQTMKKFFSNLLLFILQKVKKNMSFFSFQTRTFTV